MKLYNSYTNTLETFKSIKENEVGIYVCGPTVYNYIHIGNARPIIVFDVLARYFKYLGYAINFVQNFTDIDDKIIAKSIEENISFKEVTKKYINAFLEDIEKLNILKEVKRPKVSENIDEIIEMIQSLLDRDYAYILNGDVLFRVDKFKEYGKLSKQNLEELNVGARVENKIEKENPLDFVLWKKKKENEPYWESPFSQGRPGWHIECSAMSKKYLGNNFDIHAGGIDLLFPHHENEIAQSKCSCENSTFANYWLHNGYVEINGEKMSKSLNNFTLLRDILKKYKAEVLKFFMLSTHYRKPINFSEESLEIANKTLESIYDTLKRYNENYDEYNSNFKIKEYIIEFENNFKNAMEDDLNTPLAIASIHELIKKTNKELLNNTFKEVKLVSEKINDKLLNIFGIDINNIKEKNDELADSLINLLVNIRENARNNKNYELSDLIRDELLKLGIKLSDRKVKG